MESRQLYKEPSVLCGYARRHCSRPRYKSFKYCSYHIVEDPESPFTSCQYISRATNRKCQNPALKPKLEKVRMPVLCQNHLHELLQEANSRKKRKAKKRKMTQALEPEQRKQLKRRNTLMKQVMKHGNNEVRFASDSSDIDDSETGFSQDYSKAAFIDKNTVDHIDTNDTVPQFDVMSDSEVFKVTQQKLVRLQAMYIEQFKVLQRDLKEARREYVLNMAKLKRNEKSSKPTESEAASSSKTEEEEMSVMTNYRKRHGVEVLLRNRYNRKRFQKMNKIAQSSVNITIPQENTTRCTHAENHTRCKRASLPYTKYCCKHILNDPHQQLYTKCNWRECTLPVCLLNVTSDIEKGERSNDDVYCQLHAPLPPLKFKMPSVLLEYINRNKDKQLNSQNLLSNRTMESNMNDSEDDEIDVINHTKDFAQGNINTGGLLKTVDPKEEDTKTLKVAAVPVVTESLNVDAVVTESMEVDNDVIEKKKNKEKNETSNEMDESKTINDKMDLSKNNEEKNVTIVEGEMPKNNVDKLEQTKIIKMDVKTTESNMVTKAESERDDPDLESSEMKETDKDNTKSMTENQEASENLNNNAKLSENVDKSVNNKNVEVKKDDSTGKFKSLPAGIQEKANDSNTQSSEGSEILSEKGNKSLITGVKDDSNNANESKLFSNQDSSNSSTITIKTESNKNIEDKIKDKDSKTKTPLESIPMDTNESLIDPLVVSDIQKSGSTDDNFPNKSTDNSVNNVSSKFDPQTLKVSGAKFNEMDKNTINSDATADSSNSARNVVASVDTEDADSNIVDQNPSQSEPSIIPPVDINDTSKTESTVVAKNMPKADDSESLSEDKEFNQMDVADVLKETSNDMKNIQDNILQEGFDSLDNDPIKSLFKSIVGEDAITNEMAEGSNLQQSEGLLQQPETTASVSEQIYPIPVSESLPKTVRATTVSIPTADSEIPKQKKKSSSTNANQDPDPEQKDLPTENIDSENKKRKATEQLINQAIGISSNVARPLKTSVTQHAPMESLPEVIKNELKMPKLQPISRGFPHNPSNSSRFTIKASDRSQDKNRGKGPLAKIIQPPVYSDISTASSGEEDSKSSSTSSERKLSDEDIAISSLLTLCSTTQSDNKK